jgi:uncharacterized protein YeaO (DUF488 family)
MIRIKIKRIYEPAEKDDGFRVLVDRLWPRGVSKKEAGIDLWLKEIAPSNDLRKLFCHDPEKWQEFKKRYFQELETKSELLEILEKKAESGTITLVILRQRKSFQQRRSA